MDDPYGCIRSTLARLQDDDPPAARRAATAIAAALSGTQRSIWPEVAWRASTLAADGFPLEFGWASDDPSIRWTAEVAGPETRPGARLDHAITVLRSVGQDVELPPWLSHLAPKARRFGVWLGGRHGPAQDRFKLYVELPGVEAEALVLQFLPVDLTRAVPSRVEWRMVGFDCQEGHVELYGRIARQERWELDRVLFRCGFESQALWALTADLIDTVGERSTFPGTTGLSLGLSANGAVAAVGWFAFVGSLLGNGPVAKRRLASTIDRFGWDGRVHDAICGRKPDPGYGMLGAGVDRSGLPRLQVGCRPNTG